jgi:nucleoside-diphosphate-sugar epimerase
MRVIVTGATGNVGTAVVRTLEAEPSIQRVVGLARRGADIEADVAADDLTAAFAGADAVVHLAWKFQPTHDPDATWDANVRGSQRVFAAVATAGVSTLVHLSSVGAYSPNPGAYVTESWPTDARPAAAYGREKAYVERALDAFEARHPAIRVVRFRPAFIFQRPAAAEQRRIFAGPFVPRGLLRPGRLPILPVPEGLRFQALHATDVAEAVRLALTRDVRGAFNLAAGPVIDAEVLGQVLEAKPVTVSARLARAAVAAGWHARLVPAEPALLDLVLSLPLLDTHRAVEDLAWRPRRSSVDALREAVVGMADGAGGRTEPLAPDSVDTRLDELSTAVGGRDA